MKIDLLLSPFDADWGRLRDVATLLDGSRFDTLWTFDHLSGEVVGRHWAYECFTTLGALATATEHIGLGALVANVATRNVGVLAAAAATVQDISVGRLRLGLGAGAGPTSRFAVEQHALGIDIPPLAARHDRLVETCEALKLLWTSSGAVDHAGDHAVLDGAAGWLRADPMPPFVVGVSSVTLARRAAPLVDGINVAGDDPRMVEILTAASEAVAAAGRDPQSLELSVFLPFDADLCDADHPERKRLARAGVRRLVLLTAPPLPARDIEAAARRLG
ncbi:MAG: LLM class flavin-dependent oxidoreductase [Actinomycetota bacterium]|nr:LLM class flavin-dependent oxidoreductase [Actinomycetota bacterium]